MVRSSARALLCVFAALAGAEERQPAVTVPVETFRADRDAADAARVARERAPVAPQRVFELPPPTPAERRAADEADAVRALPRVRARVAPPADGASARSTDPPAATAEAADPPQPGHMVQRAGIGRDLGEILGGVPDTAGLSWETAADGGLVAAFALTSSGARAVRARLVVESAPPGVEVRVYDALGSAHTVEPVPRHQLLSTGAGAVQVWTPTVPGETVTVELYLPPGTAPGALEVSVPTLSHLDADPMRLSDVGAASCPHTDVACAADRISPRCRGTCTTVGSPSWRPVEGCFAELAGRGLRDRLVHDRPTARTGRPPQMRNSSLGRTWAWT